MSDENNEAKEIKFDLEVAPIESITRAEIDVQIATAHQFPRSLQQFYKRAEAMVTLDEDTAASCLFKITRGGKAIEGESIRMAEIVASCYGNLRSAVQISGYTPTRVSVRAVCHDLETNNFIAVEKQAKTTYSNGQPYNEDMAIMIANATISKALRDAIFRVVPKALLKPLIEKAKLVAIGTAETLKLRRAKAMTWVTGLKIDKARVFNVLGVVGEEDIGLEQLETLTGLRTAIKEGDQSVDEAFPPLDIAANKPMFDHPAKKEQETTKAAAATKPETKPVEAKKETKTKAAPAPEPTPEPKVETKPEPDPTPVTVSQAPEGTGFGVPATPDPGQQAPAEHEPEKTEATAADFPNMPEEPAKNPGELSDAQTTLKREVLAMGHSFEDFASWVSMAIPTFKVNPPKSWSDIPDAKADFFALNKKGINAGINTWKGKANK